MAALHAANDAAPAPLPADWPADLFGEARTTCGDRRNVSQVQAAKRMSGGVNRIRFQGAKPATMKAAKRTGPQAW